MITAMLWTRLVTIAIAASISLPSWQIDSRVGLISWYGGEFFEGRTTASGSKYHGDRMACASRRLPFGTLVVLIEEQTQAMSWCIVNDRGPYGALLEDGTWVKKFRASQPGVWRAILDVTPATAWKLASRRKQRHIYGMRARIFYLRPTVTTR